jgi:hypothetical protein
MDLHPYPLNVKVGDEVIDWQVYYMQCFLDKDSAPEQIEKERPVFQGRVVALEKPADFIRDSGGYEWSEGCILVEFGDGQQFAYPVTREHYLAKVGEGEVPLPLGKTYGFMGITYGAFENISQADYVLDNYEHYKAKREQERELATGM